MIHQVIIIWIAVLLDKTLLGPLESVIKVDPLPATPKRGKNHPNRVENSANKIRLAFLGTAVASREHYHCSRRRFSMTARIDEGSTEPPVCEVASTYYRGPSMGTNNICIQ